MPFEREELLKEIKYLESKNKNYEKQLQKKRITEEECKSSSLKKPICFYHWDSKKLQVLTNNTLAFEIRILKSFSLVAPNE